MCRRSSTWTTGCATGICSTKCGIQTGHVLWLVGDNTVILPETLATIKLETGCKLLYSTGTSPIVFSRPIERSAARLYDLVLVNDYYHGIQWLELGAKDMVCLPVSACDPDFHHPYTLTEKRNGRHTPVMWLSSGR
ncbi:MAG: hypothetical protein H6671_12375 [Anaerolineaceae bacterium]|nr:hypothetical protein [Anaerolineaceae bacterium]